MRKIKKIIKNVPGISLMARKARLFLQSYEYKRALSRIKSTKEKIIQRHLNAPDKKIVVAFIIQYIPSWNKLKPVYDKLIKDNDFKVLLLCVPSLFNETRIDKSVCNTTENDTFNYFKNNGYECINALQNGTWFDLEKCEPDYIFHSRPYNHFMPKPYTSSEISKYALICNVLYAASLTCNGREVTLNFDYFKNVCFYFAFDKFEAEFYQKRFRIGIKRGIQKCYTYGATGLEQVLTQKSKWNNIFFKKTVIWTPRWSTDIHIGGSNFFRYKETIELLIDNYSDVLFIIRPHPLMFGNFIKTGEMSEQEVTDFKNYCYDRINVLLDEEKEYVDTFWQSDYLISDASGIVPEYYVTNKPIIYCNSNADFVYADYAVEMFKNSYIVNDPEELIKAFKLLYSDNDYKKIDREKSFINIFGDIQNSSKGIVKVLRSGIKQYVN